MATFIGRITIDALWRPIGQTYAQNVLLERVDKNPDLTSAVLIRLAGNSGTFNFVTPARTLYINERNILVNLRPLWDASAGEINWGMLWRIEVRMRYNSYPAEFIAYEVY
jgi:hypothetical protein